MKKKNNNNSKWAFHSIQTFFLDVSKEHSRAAITKGKSKSLFDSQTTPDEGYIE
jgi:hypothetical protein